MNKHLWKSQLTPYEADYALWCAEQGTLLREGRLSDIDRENLAEEIESLGRQPGRRNRKPAQCARHAFAEMALSGRKAHIELARPRSSSSGMRIAKRLKEAPASRAIRRQCWTRNI